MPSPLPNDFSGLLFAPSEENAVYVLLGLLWRHLPVQIAFESFETDPAGQTYDHTKWLDAKGKLFEEGEWKDASIEFKHRSSGFRTDLVKHPGVTADLLICWEHDAPDVENHVGRLIELRRIFWSLPPEERSRLIWKPDNAGKIPRAQSTVQTLISSFSPSGQTKVQAMVDYWESVSPGRSELKFYAGKTTAIRVYKYKREYLLVISRFAIELPDLVEKYHGKQSQEGVRVSLEPLSVEDVLSILESVRVLARCI